MRLISKATGGVVEADGDAAAKLIESGAFVAEQPKPAPKPAPKPKGKPKANE